MSFYANSKRRLPTVVSNSNQVLRQFVENANQPENEVITMNMLDNPAFIAALAEKLKAA